MKKILLLLLLSPAVLRADVPRLSTEALADPAKALAREKNPLPLAEALLEAGEEQAVRSFIATLPGRRDALANKLRALAEFHDGNTAGALQSLENVEKDDLWTLAEKKRLRALTALQTSRSEHRSENFVLSVPQKDDFLARLALPVLENAREKAALFYGMALSTPIRVEIHDDADSFSAAAGVPGDALARTGLFTFSRHGRIYLLSPATAPGGYRWLDALAAAHDRLVTTRLSGGLAPVWLTEGLARRRETAWRQTEEAYAPAPSDVNRLAEAALVNPGPGNQLLPFARLEGGLASLRSREEVLLAQAQAADAVEVLLAGHGRDKMTTTLKAFRQLSREDAFLKTLGAGETELESSWRRSLGNRTWTLAKGALDRDAAFKAEPPATPAVQPFLKAGDAFRAKGQWAKAAAEYRKALTEEPENGLILSRVAEAASAQDDPAAAEERLRAAVAKNPFFVPPFAELGQLLYDDGRYEEAQQVLQEGLEIQPFHPRLHETLGFISMDVGDVASARRSFQLALRFNPKNAALREVLSKMPKK